MRSSLRTLLIAATLAASIALLHLLGRGSLAAPPLSSWCALTEWAGRRDPVTLAMAVLRLVALLVAYHLVITSALVTLGHVLHLPSLVAWADAATLPAFRGTAQRIVGVGMSASTLLAGPAAAAATAAAGPQGASSAVALIERIDPGPAGEEPATLRLITEPSEVPGAVLRSLDHPAPAPLPEPTTHLVRLGDHLWSVAETTLVHHLGRPVSDAEIDPYWRRVIAANPQLADPDLLYPGDTINVPPMP